MTPEEMEHPDHGPIGLGPGWRPDLNRPGYYIDPKRPGWLRDRQGHWYDAKDVDGVRREVEEVSDQAVLETPQERFRKALRERRGQ
jgi:hypothetical protein